MKYYPGSSLWGAGPWNQPTEIDLRDQSDPGDYRAATKSLVAALQESGQETPLCEGNKELDYYNSAVRATRSARRP